MTKSEIVEQMIKNTEELIKDLSDDDVLDVICAYGNWGVNKCKEILNKPTRQFFKKWK